MYPGYKYNKTLTNAAVIIAIVKLFHLASSTREE